MAIIQNIFFVNKKVGETPLEALERFRRKNRKLKNTKLTYAGRLDPMAEGLLLILAGEEIKQKEKYLKLSKVCEFEILFDFATDTYDILGKVNQSPVRTNGTIDLEKKIKENLKSFKGKFIQKYPLYSSKTIKKARAGIAVEASAQEVYVKSLKFLKLRKINSQSLLKNIEKRIKKVRGDFRQKEIIKIWKGELQQGESLLVGKFSVNCSSGTYVRGIANSLGEKLGVPALAFSIRRVRIGKWSLEQF